jgi:hypothetical protein
MSTHHSRSRRRSHLFGPSNAAGPAYNPFFAEGIAAFHRHDHRLEKAPAFPRIIVLPPTRGFIHPCTREQVAERLAQMPPAHLAALRAVFLLSGRRKQVRSWYSDLACYGFYWNDCVFLCAHPYELRERTVDALRDYYLNDVLVHEVAHHIDRHRNAPDVKKENFANGFVEQQVAKRRGARRHAA